MRKAKVTMKAWEKSPMDKKMDAGKPKGYEGSKADKKMDAKGMKMMRQKK